ncbi:unnamed protein product [Echinostoma caproni]|uniref:Dynein regulatory complex subunit 4 n=1 Tax=Echinostoma caproni TaxID=27848 RepID=A0A183AA87_9TREM|nr:unnamed protein product [Echinostoma caproni]
MPPAKKKEKKGKRESKGHTVIHGVSTADMTKEEIESYVILLREELDRERQERNLAALEKDKIMSFWELSKKNLEDARALLSKKERELEDADERHQLEMKVDLIARLVSLDLIRQLERHQQTEDRYLIYRQKLKHLMFEQNSREAEAKRESLQGLSNAKDEARAEIRAIRNENYALKTKLRQQQVQSEEAVKILKRKHELDMAHIRQDFARQTEEIENRAAKQMIMLRDQVDTQRRVEVHMTEEHKNNHIQNLEANHERAFANMKAYYNDITLGNVSVIKTLRENIDELRSQLARIQRLLDSSQNELSQKTNALTKMEKENAHLRQVAKLYECEKSAHSLTKQNAKKTQTVLQKTETNLNIMTARYEGLNKMRSTLATQFEHILLEVEQRMGLRALLVERKLQHLAQVLEAREAQIMQLVIALEGDPGSVAQARQHLETAYLSVYIEAQFECFQADKGDMPKSAEFNRKSTDNEEDTNESYVHTIPQRTM